MDKEVLNFLGGLFGLLAGLLAFLTVLIPIIRNAYQTAKERGAQRFLIYGCWQVSTWSFW
jgi:hypothetical protein